MTRIIEVTISSKGETSIQTKGYSGSECQQASKFLEKALGIVSAEQKMAEFYQAAQTNQQQENQA